MTGEPIPDHVTLFSRTLPYLVLIGGGKHLAFKYYWRVELNRSICL